MSGKLAVTPAGRRPICDNECQANRTWLIRVRHHADGRAKYGVYATNFQNGQTAVPCWTPERVPGGSPPRSRIDGTAAPENPTHSYRKSAVTDPRTLLCKGSAVVDDRTIQVARGFADLETDARRQAGFRVWTQVLSGERDTERDEH